MGDASSLFGGSSLANLFGLGAAAAPTGDGTAAAADQNVPAGYDPGTGLPYPTSTYDPTGTLGAQAAVTGTPTGIPGAGANVGGTQSDQNSGQPPSQNDSWRNPTAQAAAPQPVTPQSVASLMAGQSPTNPFQPGGTPATFADRFGTGWQSSQRDPEGKQDPAGTQYQPTVPPGQMADASAAPASASSGFAGAAPDNIPLPKPRPAEADEDATPPKADTTPPPQASQPGMGRGGMPGGAGNLLQDIVGLMSGNPMALGKLVQDLMGMAGGRQMPGWDQPFMRPNQASPYTQAGDPSTFGGPQYAGATPSDEPDERGEGPADRTPISMPGIRQIPPNIRNVPTRPNTAPMDPTWAFAGPGYNSDISKPSAMAPLPQSSGTIGPTKDAVASAMDPKSGLGGAGGLERFYPAPKTGPMVERLQHLQRQNQLQVARVGQDAGTPLTNNEASVPEWSPAAQRGRPSMRPTQPNVDRSRFQSEANPETIAKAAWMVAGEVSLNAPVRAQIVQLETAFNRAQARGTTLNHALLPSVRRGDPGYYDGRSQHPTYGMSKKPTPQQIAAFKARVWDPVMKGSNLSDVGWGPMTGNASGKTARDQFAGGAQGYKMAGGDTYFREGPFKYPFPTVRQQMASQ